MVKCMPRMTAITAIVVSSADVVFERPTFYSPEKMRRSLTLALMLLLLLTQAVFCQEDAQKKEDREKKEKRQVLGGQSSTQDWDPAITQQTQNLYNLYHPLSSNSSVGGFPPPPPMPGRFPVQSPFYPGDRKREILGQVRERTSDPENPWTRMNPLIFDLYNQLRPKVDAPPAEGLPSWRYPPQSPFLPGNLGYPFGHQQLVSPLLTMMYPWHRPQDGYLWGGDDDADDHDEGYLWGGDDDADDHDEGYLWSGDDDTDDHDEGYLRGGGDDADDHDEGYLRGGGHDDDDHDEHDEDRFYPQGVYPLGAVPHDDGFPLPGGDPFGAIPHADQDDHEPLSGGYASGEVPHADHDDGEHYPGAYPYGAFPHGSHGAHFHLHGGYPTGFFPFNQYSLHPGGYPYPFGALPFQDGYPYPFRAFPSAVLPVDQNFPFPLFSQVPDPHAGYLPGGVFHPDGYPFGAYPHYGHLTGHPPGLDDPAQAFPWGYPGYGWHGHYPDGRPFYDAYYDHVDYPHYDTYPRPFYAGSVASSTQKSAGGRPSNKSISQFLDSQSWITTNVFNTTKTTSDIANALRDATSVDDLGLRLDLSPEQVNTTRTAFQAAKDDHVEPLKQLGMDAAHMKTVKHFFKTLMDAGLHV